MSARVAAHRNRPAARYDVLIVGAGLSGMYQLYAARRLGLTVHVFDAGQDVGGTWAANRYPGCRFDSESYTYGFSFSDEILKEWSWSELFASQPETQRYLAFVADRLDLRRDISFGARVESAVFDETADEWVVTTDLGVQARGRILITAIGVLSAPVIPAFLRREAFRGRHFHTADWPREGIDLAGKRVAVIGTGSTGIQVIQEAAKVASHLAVFQREASWCKPLRNRALDAAQMDAIRSGYDEIFALCRESFAGFIHTADPRATFDLSDAERLAVYEARYAAPGFALNLGNFQDIATDERAAKEVGDFLAGKIRARIDDPAIAELLIPKDHLFGTRRVAMETNYFEVFNQANVTLYDVNATPIESFTEAGICIDGRELAFDIVIYATGFDAILGAFDRIDIRGVDGLSLRDKWAEGPRTYLGMAGAGFPNMFTLVGPHSAGTFCNVPRCAEQNVEFVTALLRHMGDLGLRRVEAEPEAETRWMDYIVKEAASLLVMKTNSWFTGVNLNVPGRMRRQMLLFTGGQKAYAQYCDRIVEAGYDGFRFGSARTQDARTRGFGGRANV